MRVRPWVVPIGVVMLLVTSGCAEPAPEPAASDSAAAGEAFFASEEEAKEAALAVYAEYAATADAIMADGGANPERLEPLADDELYKMQSASFARMQADRVLGTGTTTFELHKWQQDPQLDRPGLTLTAYICRDVSGTDLLNSAGESVVVDGRLDRIPTQVTWTMTSGGSLKVSRDEPWLRENFCV